MSQYNVYLNATRYATYYVDATLGDDGNPGTIAEPWQTTSKVNFETASLNPGDQILLKRGEIFVGRLAPTVAGAAGNYITIGAYGSGARPIIDGNASSGGLYVNGASYNYLRFESLDFYRCVSATYSPIYLLNANNITLYDCIARESDTTSGIIVIETGTTVYGILLDTCVFHDNGKNGASCNYSTRIADVNFVNCTAYNNGTILGDHGFYVAHGSTIDNCIAYNNYDAGFKLNDNELGPAGAYYPVLKNSISYGNKVGVTVTNAYAKVFNNLFYSNTVNNINIYGNALGGTYKIYFNTFVNSIHATTRGLVFALGVSPNSEIKNNLFIQDTTVCSRSNIDAGAGITTADIVGAYGLDYNVYYYTGSSASNLCYISGDTGNELKTWAEWTGDGAEPHGTHITGDTPDFVTNYTNLHPANGGNLKGLGVAIAGYEYDKNGVLRSDPPTPGCYETTV